jgi:putative addiction module component (TIGR02574 family)
MNAAIKQEVSNMSIEEKIILVEDLWDMIVASEDEIPLSSSQKHELDKRFENYENNPETAISWEKMKARLK